MKTTLNTSMQISTRRLNRLELIWGFHRYSLWCKNTEFVVKIRFKEKRPNNIYAWVRASILPQKICPKKPCKKANYSPVVERLAQLWLLNPSSRCASWAPSWEFKSPGEQQEQRAQDAQLCAEEGAWNQVWLSNLRRGTPPSSCSEWGLDRSDTCFQSKSTWSRWWLQLLLRGRIAADEVFQPQ